MKPRVKRKFIKTTANKGAQRDRMRINRGANALKEAQEAHLNNKHAVRAEQRRSKYKDTARASSEQ